MKKIGKYTPHTWREYVRMRVSLSSLGFLCDALYSAVVQSYAFATRPALRRDPRRIMSIDVEFLENSTSCYPGAAWSVVWFRVRHIWD